MTKMELIQIVLKTEDVRALGQLQVLCKRELELEAASMKASKRKPVEIARAAYKFIDKVAQSDHRINGFLVDSKGRKAVSNGCILAIFNTDEVHLDTAKVNTGFMDVNKVMVGFGLKGDMKEYTITTGAIRAAKGAGYVNIQLRDTVLNIKTLQALMPMTSGTITMRVGLNRLSPAEFVDAQGYCEGLVCPMRDVPPESIMVFNSQEEQKEAEV